jgi:hypothetical protein
VRRAARAEEGKERDASSRGKAIDAAAHLVRRRRGAEEEPRWELAPVHPARGRRERRHHHRQSRRHGGNGSRRGHLALGGGVRDGLELRLPLLQVLARRLYKSSMGRDPCAV